VPAISSSMRSA